MAAVSIRIEGLEELAAKLAVDVTEIVDDAAEPAAQRIVDAVVEQDWYDGSWIFPVKSGELRRAGEANGNTVVWDKEYARFIEARGGFFRPKVEEVGPDIFVEEIKRRLDEAFEGG